MLVQKTYYPKSGEVTRDWVEIDGSGKIVGRLASEIASVLRGKRKPVFTPGMDCGDFVIVLNAGKVRFTGKKLYQKKYYRHSGYVGGLKFKTAKELLAQRPEMVIMNAVKGMLPKTSLGRSQLRKLKVYSSSSHPHAAQSVKKWDTSYA